VFSWRAGKGDSDVMTSGSELLELDDEPLRDDPTSNDMTGSDEPRGARQASCAVRLLEWQPSPWPFSWRVASRWCVCLRQPERHRQQNANPGHDAEGLETEPKRLPAPSSCAMMSANRGVTL
jgi:hypothetical protein